MIQHCGTDYNEGAGCGARFDDAQRMTICPHPRLDDPTWREQIEGYKGSGLNPLGEHAVTKRSTEDGAIARVRRLFLDKLYADSPEHPFCRLAQRCGSWKPEESTSA